MKKIIYCGILAFITFQGVAQEPDISALKKLNATFIYNFVTNDTTAPSHGIEFGFFKQTFCLLERI